MNSMHSHQYFHVSKVIHSLTYINFASLIFCCGKSIIKKSTGYMLPSWNPKLKPIQRGVNWLASKLLTLVSFTDKIASTPSIKCIFINMCKEVFPSISLSFIPILSPRAVFDLFDSLLHNILIPVIFPAQIHFFTGTSIFGKVIKYSEVMGFTFCECQ